MRGYELSQRFSIALRRHQSDPVESAAAEPAERVDYRALQKQAKEAGIPVKQTADKLQAALKKADK